VWGDDDVGSTVVVFECSWIGEVLGFFEFVWRE
jgi:hypothetical protein